MLLSPTMLRSTRQQKRDVTRTRLRQSAVRLFVSQGVAAASVDGISAAAGLSRGAFYANYGAKEDLLLELMAEWLEQEAVEWRRVVAQACDVEAVLHGFVARFRRSDAAAGLSHGLLWVELTLHAERHPGFAQHYRTFVTAHHAHVAEMFVALFDKAGRKPPAPPAALAAASMSFGSVLSLRCGHGAADADPAHAGAMFLLYLRGLLAVAEPLVAPPASLPSPRSSR